MTIDKKETAATIAYLIGVRKHILEYNYKLECHDTLENLYKDRDATTIRYLCKLRTALMQNLSKIDTDMVLSLKNLKDFECFDKENIEQLEKWGFSIIKANFRAKKYIVYFTDLINNNLGKCARLFYDWQRWEYIEKLFKIPKYNKPEALDKECIKYKSNMRYYPYQMYINWLPADHGNILYNDAKILKLLYEMNNERFVDNSKCQDAGDETKNNIYNFISKSDKTAIVVDCENSDVYKLFGVLSNLNQEELKKIEKITLYDDECYSNAGWGLINKFTKIPVEHIKCKRVADQKSLVDLRLTAGVCADHYRNNISSFIIFSSDSDYWSLISSLPEANFLVMYEYSKCGQAIKKALDEHDIFYCSIDDFYSGNTESFKMAALFSVLEKSLPDLSGINGKELAKQAYKEARIKASDIEVRNFFMKYIQTIHLNIDDSGNFSFEIAKK